ncbi:MAG: RAMP superfamily CRISPR-associated protein [Cyanobacteria bacterium J06576_12]
MHKRLVNNCTLDISLIPQGPILIKSGREGADPTKPDMEFVETYHAGDRTIYLPGSSIKGALRAHAERIVRTIGTDQRPRALETSSDTLWASDPLDHKGYAYLEKEQNSQKVYKWSSFTDQLFGSVVIASRFRIEDAYPVDPQQIKTEERNGVAIDRVFGSVAVGPFNYQVCTAGEFRTKIHLKNFTLEQLGLIGLVLRDLSDGWFGIGFAKSRGMGLVEVKLNEATVDYPGCVLKGEKIRLLGGALEWPQTMLIGAGAFLQDAERAEYGFPADDIQDTSITAEEMAYGLGVRLRWPESQVGDLFTLAVSAWRQRLERVAA